MSENVSLRELLEQRFDSQDEKLDAIVVQTTATNGRLRTAEKAIAVLNWALGAGGIVLGWLVLEAIRK